MDIKALRQKILDLAIRGKLVPQDPNDEPASVLLERIRAEKQQMVKDGKLKPIDIKNDTVIFKGDNNLHYEKFSDGTIKCIEDEIPFDVPNNWEWCRLNSIVDVRDGTHDTPAYVDKGIPLITSKNLIEGGIDYTNVKYISEKDALSINERSGVNIGDILFAMIGTIGNPSMVTEDVLISIKNVALFKFTYSDNLSNYFIMYFLDYAQEDMKKRPSGGLQPFVSLNFLRTYLVPIPPVEEQHRIASILTDSINSIRKIEIFKNEFAISLEKVKSKILDLAIRGKLVPQDPNDEPASVLLERIRAEKEELIKQGKIKRSKKESVIFKGSDNSYYQDLPETWKLVNFKDCATLISGRDLSKDEYNSNSIGIPYITGASNFINGNILINRWTTAPKTVSLENDILITCKGTVGELAINKYGEIHIARQIMAIRVYTNINLEYIKLFLESIVMEIKKSANGLIPGISRDDMLNLSIPLPPIAEQKRIVEAIETIFTKLDEIANQVA